MDELLWISTQIGHIRFIGEVHSDGLLLVQSVWGLEFCLLWQLWLASLCLLSVQICAYVVRIFDCCHLHIASVVLGWSTISITTPHMAPFWTGWLTLYTMIHCVRMLPIRRWLESWAWNDVWRPWPMNLFKREFKLISNGIICLVSHGKNNVTVTSNIPLWRAFVVYIQVMSHVGGGTFAASVSTLGVCAGLTLFPPLRPLNVEERFGKWYSISQEG